MRTNKIVNRQDVLNDSRRILTGVEDRIKGIVLGILSGIETNLAGELKGVALEVMKAVMDFEIAQVAGVKGKHTDGRRYSRWGHNPGSVILDGAKVSCEVPRALSPETRQGYRLKSYPLFRQTGEMVKRAYRDLIRGISTRRYAEGIDQFLHGHGISASTISRHMVTATAAKVKELFTRSLATLELCVLMIDGVEVGGHTVVIALGIDTKGVKHVLGLRQGATENAAVVKGLLEDLLGRGLSPDQAMLVVIDGAKALRKAVDAVFGETVAVQRCTVHKKRNVLDHLPKGDRTRIGRRMSQAYGLTDFGTARRELQNLAKELYAVNPSAARSLEEGLEETLTVQRLGLPEPLRVTLRSTNTIESSNSGVRDRSHNVKRWQGGDHVERWTAAGLLETEKSFRRIKGYRDLSVLQVALENYRKKRQSAA